MDTPDALRLSRLDKLINQLGEHQLSIRQQVRSAGLKSCRRQCFFEPRSSPPSALQGTSVTDLDERLKALDKRVADELQALWPLRVSGGRRPLPAAPALPPARI